MKKENVSKNYSFELCLFSRSLGKNLKNPKNFLFDCNADFSGNF